MPKNALSHNRTATITCRHKVLSVRFVHKNASVEILSNT